jgi:hypothetical protein
MQGKWKLKSEGLHTIPDLGIKNLTNKELTNELAERIIKYGLSQLLEKIETAIEKKITKRRKK